VDKKGEVHAVTNILRGKNADFESVQVSIAYQYGGWSWLLKREILLYLIY
jgi:hypothetical protein